MSSTLTVSTPIYRPKRVPRVLRRQAPLIRLLVVCGMAATLGLMVAWRNFSYQQLTIDVARQRAQLHQIDQEIQHLTGSIEAAAPYNEVADWANREHGWKLRSAQVDSIRVPSQSASPLSHDRAKFPG
ncbi:MAG: hypothetical protein IPK53_06870 [bacterium]|nr:hypothetical protein [bacterium]MBK8128668.1 hypothetical protein [bacterium]